MPSDNAVPLADPAAESTPAAPERRCQNCNAPLLGEHCYACGQPTKGLVRHFSSIIGDFLDSAFNIDTRLLRTVFPLMFKPGYLSEEYFAGRRVRYVSPVRLFVFLSILTFFAAQLNFSIDADHPGDDPLVVIDPDDDSDTNRLHDTRTVAEVEKIRDAALADLRKAKAEAEASGVPGVGVGLDIAEHEVVREAEQRIAEIHKSEETGEPLPMSDPNDGNFNLNGEPWDAKSNPLRIGWLPDAVNDKLNDSISRAKGNLKRIKEDPNRLKDAFLSTVPTTLFVLLPLFAMLLKIAYAFKRRLYMEHLIVALHSHSFLCASLLLAMGADAMAALATLSPVSWLFGTIEFVVLAWMPIYLLLMQKRVYRQGWIMTLLKYGVLGTCYFMLLMLGAAGSLMVSLVSM